MDNKGAVTAEVVLRTAVRTRLRLNATTKKSLWSLRQQQREFYNKGVEIGLFARNNGESIPSNYTAHTSVLTAVRKDKTHRWARQNLTLQRSGLNAGLESVRKWSKHRKNLENNLDYWTKRVKKDPEVSKSLRKRSVAEQKLSKHREAGTKRLFRKRSEEETASGSALVYGGRASLITTERGMAVRLSGGLILPLRDKGFDLPEGHTFTGAVQVVDITDLKGRVTRKTHPHHRTYNIHLSCTMGAPAPIRRRLSLHARRGSHPEGHRSRTEKASALSGGIAEVAQAQPKGDLSQQGKDQPQAERTPPHRQGHRHHQSCGGVSRGSEGQEYVGDRQRHQGAPRCQCGSEEGTEQGPPRSGHQSDAGRHRAFLPEEREGLLGGGSPLHISDLLSMWRDRQTREASVCLYWLWRLVPSGLQRVVQCKESGIPDTDVDGGGQVRSSKDAQPQPERAASRTSVLSNAPAPCL